MKTVSSGFLALLVIAAAALPAESANLTIFENRQIAFAVPKDWTFDYSMDEDTGVQTVGLTDPSGEIELSISFLPDPDNELSSKTAVEQRMKAAFEDTLRGAVERDMKCTIAKTVDGLIGHTVFTDKKWVNKSVPADERLYATQGIRSWPGVYAVFTLLSNDLTSGVYKEGLKIVVSGMNEVNRTSKVAQRKTPLRDLIQQTDARAGARAGRAGGSWRWRVMPHATRRLTQTACQAFACKCRRSSSCADEPSVDDGLGRGSACIFGVIGWSA